MRKIALIFGLMIVTTVFLNFCDSSDGPTSNGDLYDKKYNVFYYLSQSDGWRPEHSGLFQYYYDESSAPERILSESIVHISAVGENGKIAFEYENAPHRYWAGTENDFTPIPFPESSYNGWIYDYVTDVGVELSLDGKKAAYYARYHPVAEFDTLRGTEYNLVVFDFEEWNLEQYNLTEYISNNLQGVDMVEPVASNILINETGDKVWFALKCYKDDNGLPNDLGYMVVVLNNGELKAASSLQSERIELVGLDYKTEKVFLNLNSNLSYLTGDKDIGETSFEVENLSGPRQFAAEKSIAAVWTENGIALYNPVTEGKIEDVISWEAIEAEFPGFERKATDYIAVSPDGGLIVFGLDKNSDPPSYDLFCVRANGEGLKRVVPDTPIGKPSISYGY